MARSKGLSKNITLMDVARAAGVAPMTVSRFLNQHPNISEKTARRVSAAVKRLGYSPNLAARMLMGQPSNAVGLIVPNLADTFYSEVAHSIQEAARERGMLVWVAASNSDQTTEAALISQMKQHRVDGILLIPTPRKMPFVHDHSGPPIVMLDRPVRGSGCDAVLVENRRASFEAVEHLLWHGYKRIACISGDDADLYTAHERIAGYVDAMRARGLRSEVKTLCKTVDEVKASLHPAMSGPRSLHAIFTTNNVTTVHVMEALGELGLNIPKDIALVGFDDFELASLTRPSLTVVRQPGADLGKRAARLLFERIASSEDTKAVNIALPASLVVRESCGCPRRRRDSTQPIPDDRRPSQRRRSKDAERHPRGKV
jgi:LacI family transcriptional regulator